MRQSKVRQFAVLGSTLAGCLALLTACGGGSDDTPASQRSLQLQVPGVTSSNSYSFDLGAVDTTTGTYYVTDRTSKSVDVVDIASRTLKTQFKPGFAGCFNTKGVAEATCGSVNGVGINNDASGPDGLDVVGSNLYVGDVNKLWVLDKSTGAVVTTIAIPSTPTGLRADEGCFDPVDNIYAISTPGADNPFMTFVDTSVASAPKVIATLVMNGPDGANSGGLEACAFDKTTGVFFVNNDGSTASPHGEMDGIPAAAILALKPRAPVTVGNTAGGWQSAIAGAKVFALPAVCDPTGIAVGPNNEIGAMCRPGTLGASLDFVILNKVTGATVATVVGAGGGDQITYDAASNRYYLADNRSTANLKSCGGGSATCPLTPKLVVVDGTSHAIVNSVSVGNNAHSIAVGSGYAFSPFDKPSATGGGTAFDVNGAGSGGIFLVPLSTL
jgi:hypothetical protein